jgi:hypothetical protein
VGAEEINFTVSVRVCIFITVIDTTEIVCLPLKDMTYKPGACPRVQLLAVITHIQF